jgi:hypothetical protein
MARQGKPRYTTEEYLALERASKEKNEFGFGEIYAMGGGLRPGVSRSSPTSLVKRPANPNPTC